MAPATPQHTDSMQWATRVVPVACAEARRRGAREGLSPLSARGVGHAPAAAQPSRKSQPSSPDANPVQGVAGTVLRHGWVPLGPTETGEAARGAANVLLGSFSTFTTEPLVALACIDTTLS